MMNPLLIINVIFVFLSWKWAQECDMWSFGWWINMFASAFNAVAIVMFLGL